MSVSYVEFMTVLKWMCELGMMPMPNATDNVGTRLKNLFRNI